MDLKYHRILHQLPNFAFDMARQVFYCLDFRHIFLIILLHGIYMQSALVGCPRINIRLVSRIIYEIVFQMSQEDVAPFYIIGSARV